MQCILRVQDAMLSLSMFGSRTRSVAIATTLVTFNGTVRNHVTTLRVPLVNTETIIITAVMLLEDSFRIHRLPLPRHLRLSQNSQQKFALLSLQHVIWLVLLRRIHKHRRHMMKTSISSRRLLTIRMWPPLMTTRVSTLRLESQKSRRWYAW